MTGLLLVWNDVRQHTLKFFEGLPLLRHDVGETFFRIPVDALWLSSLV